MTYTLSIQKRLLERNCKYMVKNEDYKNLLKRIIACVNYGDYYSIKELSKLQLDNINKINKKIEQELKEQEGIKKLSKCKGTPIETWSNEELQTLLKMYSNYIVKKIEETKSINELQKITVTIDEFIKNI